jgi:hypothetical protein
MTGWFGVVYLVGLCVGAVPALGFPVLYTFRSRWWRSEMGRHLFAYSVLFAVLYVNGLARLVFQVPAAVQVWINLFLVVFAAVVAWQRVLVYAHAQHQRGVDNPGPSEADTPDT